MSIYQVIVENIGIAYDGDNKHSAEQIYDYYVNLSMAGMNIPVTLMAHDDIYSEYEV